MPGGIGIFIGKTQNMRKIYLSIVALFFLVHMAQATVHVIQVSNFMYTPSDLAVSCGDTVRFQWITGTHPTTSESGLWTTFTLSAAMPTFDVVIAAAGTYPYYCEFHGGAGGIGMSGTITATCAPPVCNTPTGVAAINITSNSAKIKWDAVAGATKYQIYYRVSGVATWSKANTTSLSKKLTGLSPSTTYQYKVKTICGLTSSAFSSIQTFTTMAFTDEGPDQKTMEGHDMHEPMLGVYPNPSDGTFQVVMDHVHVEQVTIRVYDISGKLLLEQNGAVADMGVVQQVKLPAGFKGNAVVKVQAGDKYYTKDILVQ